MTLNGWYLPPHQSQLALTAPAITRREGCTPTTGANGANASTGGRVTKSAGQIHALIPKAQETNPLIPGWSLTDLDRAMARLGVPFEVRSGRGWPAVVAALDAGLYVALQGDSDQFPDGTCSSVFDGDHCIGVHPASQVIGGQRQRWIDDPLCPTGRWSSEAILRRYAAKLLDSILFGVWPTPVPRPAVGNIVHIAEGATVRVYTLGTTGSPRCIRDWEDVTWTRAATKAACGPKVHRVTCDGKSGATTVLMRGLAFKDRHIRVDPPGVWVS